MEECAGMQRTENKDMAAPAARAGCSAPSSSGHSTGATAPIPSQPPKATQLPADTPSCQMDAAAWTAALRAVVDSEGGVLDNGWKVEVKRRPTGARDVTIISTEGRRYRSIVQAVAVLTGAANGAGASSSQGRPARKRSRPGKGAPEEQAGGGLGKRPRRGENDRRQEGEDGRPLQRRRRNAAGEGDGGHPIFGKLLAKARVLVARIRRELDVLEAYEAEGWRGANKGRLVVAEETQRAERQVDRLRQELRELLQRCEEGEGQPIPAEAYDSDGDLDQAHIFCAVCGRGESTDDNDIVLCDGLCRRAYHERCCVPPFRSVELQEDADWLCPACLVKDEILDLVNETLETEYELDTPAEAVLAERGGRQAPAAAAGPAEGGTWAALLGEDLNSSDGEDEDFHGPSGSEGAAADSGGSGSGTSSSDSSDSDGSEDSAEVLQGGRRRAPVDYVALADAMFGGRSESEHGSDSEGGWD